MPYLIDGHNLIGKLPDISLDDPNDEAQLVQKLNGFVARTQRRCIVVFDHGIPGGTSRMSTKGVRVIFASHPSNADTIMMNRIRKEKDNRAWIIVSSDNEVLNMARRYRMTPMKSAEFAQLLQIPERPAKPGPDEAVDLKLSADEIEEWLAIFGMDE